MGIKSKLTGIIALTALATSVFAGGPEPAPVPQPCGYFDGFYLGITGGWAWARTEDSALYNIPGTGAILLNRTFRATGNALALGGAAGYGKVFDDQFYFGGELHASYHPMRPTTRYNFTSAAIGGTVTVTQRLRQKWDWGFDFVPGYLVEPEVLFFGKIGYRGGHASTGSTSVGPVGTVVSGNSSKYLNGFNVGAGIKYHIFDHINGWVEYDYTWYGHTSSTVFGVPNTTLHRSLNTDYQQVLVGLSYSFCGLI